MLLLEIMDALLTSEEKDELLAKGTIIWPRRKQMMMFPENVRKMFSGEEHTEEFYDLGAQFLNEIAKW